jgi:uncharacterized protein YgfB (UPF0149 family)
MPDSIAIPDYSILHSALADAGVESSAAEIHGLLCGVASRGSDRVPNWSALLAAAGQHVESVPEVLQQLFARIMAAAAGSLAEGQMQFSLLLPDADAGIRVRADALGAWCQGYVMGLALGGSTGMEGLSSEAREAVADLIQISGAVADEDEEYEAQDRALSEIEEFVRVAVQLVYEEYRRAREKAVADDGVAD